MAGFTATSPLTHVRKILESQRACRADDRELLERFLTDKDETAFTALVRRHGSLVLGVCRRVLNNEHDAEDAFQATFLVLARRAGSIRKQGSVASWLHGVARRVARKAQSRQAAYRRLEQETARRAAQASASLDEMTWRELRVVLDEELGRLPEKLRAPLVLCYLEGKTRDEAARQLRLTPRTLKARLEHARDRLRQRLGRRGLTLPAALLTAMMSPSSASAIPPGLAALTVQAAIGNVVVHPGVMTLVLAILRESFMGKLKLAAGTLCLLAALGTGMLVGQTRPGNAGAVATVQPIQPKKRSAEPAPPRPNPADVAVAARTEDAIATGLHWIVRQQIKTGAASDRRRRPSHWSLPGGKHEVAATAFALLPLLEAGHTHKKSDALHPYQRNVEGGLNYLVSVQQPDGCFAESMYSHPMAAMALCEAYRRTADAALKKPAQQALDFTVTAQHEGGGWRYTPNQPGDTSVTTWHVLALAYGKRAGLNVPAETLKKANAFLDQVMSADGSGYAYTPGGSGTPTMTAAGFMCRLELGLPPQATTDWARKLGQAPPGPGCFLEFFATRALHKRGGGDWNAWSAALRKQLLQRQDSDGTWPTDGEPFGPVVGRLLLTALAILNLQACAGNDPPVPVPLRGLKADELAPLYTALGEDDFVKARHALRRLLAAPRQTVPFLAKTSTPIPEADSEKIDRWIAELNANDFAVRQKASVALERVGEQTHVALRRALAGNPSLEVRRRIERILEATADEDASPAQRRSLVAVEILAEIGTPQAREVIRTIAAGAPNARLTQAGRDALERLAKTPAAQP
jgi:RNA polymerase sigma factor (sigma-70 family)